LRYLFLHTAYTVLFGFNYERKGDYVVKKKLTFAILGGDKRSLWAAKRLREQNFETELFALENEKAFLPSDTVRADIVILPMPISRDGVHLFAPESSEPILLSDVFRAIPREAMIFGGNMTGISDERTIDYGRMGAFAVMNAVPTAEGALLLALQNGKRTVFGMHVGIVGYGKVAFAAAKLFHAVGADVTVFARKAQARAEAHMMGYTARPISELAESAGDFELLINTVPARIFDRELLSKLSEKTNLMDLASAPFGLDFEEAAELGVRAVCAPGLPGRFFPETAGRAIADTVTEILREKEFLV